MTNWTQYGPLAKMKRRAQQISHVTAVASAAWGHYSGDNEGRRFRDLDEGFWSAVQKVRSDTGLAIGVAGDTLDIRHGITCLLKQEAKGISERERMRRQLESIATVTERRRWSLSSLRETLDGVTEPSTNGQYERLALDMADAMDLHEARIRHALPALRESASYVMLIDPFVIAAQTPRMAGSPATERVRAFARSIKNWNPSSERLPFEGARRIGHIIVSHSGRYLEHEGRMHAQQRIPDSVRAGMEGKPLERLFENHPAAGMGITMTSISCDHDDETITVGTSAEHQSSLIPVDIYSQRL